MCYRIQMNVFLLDMFGICRPWDTFNAQTGCKLMYDLYTYSAYAALLFPPFFFVFVFFTTHRLNECPQLSRKQKSTECAHWPNLENVNGYNLWLTSAAVHTVTSFWSWKPTLMYSISGLGLPLYSEQTNTTQVRLQTALDLTLRPNAATQFRKWVFGYLISGQETECMETLSHLCHLVLIFLHFRSRNPELHKFYQTKYQLDLLSTVA